MSTYTTTVSFADSDTCLRCPLQVLRIARARVRDTGDRLLAGTETYSDYGVHYWECVARHVPGRRTPAECLDGLLAMRQEAVAHFTVPEKRPASPSW